MAFTERLALLITADPQQAIKGLAQVDGGLRKVSDSTPRLERVGQSMTRNITPAAMAAGAAFGYAFNEFDTGADSIRAQTGLVGDDLDSVVESMKKVGGQVPESLGAVGEAMGLIQARTKLVGPELENLTKAFLDLARLGQTVDAGQVTEALEKGGVEAEDMADALDVLFRAGQTTGVGVDTLTSIYERFGSTLSMAGYDVEESALLIGQLEAAGVNTTQVLSGMGIAFRKFAEDGKDPQVALEEITTAMANAKDPAEALAIGTEVFGRSAVEMTAVIRSGKFDLEAMQAAFDANTDSLDDAAAATLDFQDKLQMAKNKVIGAIGPFSELGMGVSGLAAVAGPAATGISKVAQSSEIAATAMKGAGAAALGAVAVWGTYTAVMEDARRAGESFAAQQSDTILSAETLDEALAKAAAGVNSTAEASRGLADNGIEAWANADAVTSLSEANQEFSALYSNLLAAKDQAGAIADQYGVSQSAAESWVTEQIRLGNTFTDTSAALSAYGGVVEENNGLTTEQVAVTEELNAALQANQDMLRAAFDPLFAMHQADQALIDAQTKLNELQAAGVWGGQEYSEALIGVGEAGLNAQFAADKLSTAIEAQPGLLDTNRAALQRLVDQQIITQAQADELTGKFGSLTAEAERFAGDYTAYVYADGSQAAQVFAELMAQAQLLAASLPEGVTAAVGPIPVQGGGSSAPAPSSSSGGSRSSGPVININGAGDPEATADAVARALRRQTMGQN